MFPGFREAGIVLPAEQSDPNNGSGSRFTGATPSYSLAHPVKTSGRILPAEFPQPGDQKQGDRPYGSLSGIWSDRSY